MPTIASLVPELRPYAHDLYKIAGANGLQPRITSARRSYVEQVRLYDRFLKGINPFPVAAPGTSAHETGEAFDMLVTPVDYLQDLGALWISWGGEWGGNRDPVHFQLPGAPSPELLEQTKGAARSGITAQGAVDFVAGLQPGLPFLTAFVPESITGKNPAAAADTVGALGQLLESLFR